MAATDLTALARGIGTVTKRVALPATAGNVREIILPTWVRHALVTGRNAANTAAADCAVATSGTDDAAQSSDAFSVGAGAALPMTFAPGGGSVFVSGDANGFVQLKIARNS